MKTTLKNAPIPLDPEEFDFWGRRACAANQSRANFLRELILRGIEASEPETATLIRRIRTMHRETAVLSMILGWGIWLLSVQSVDFAVRGAGRSGRRQDDIECVIDAGGEA